VLALVLGVVVAALVRQFSSSYEGIAARALTGEMESFAAQHPPAGEPLLKTAARYFHNHELPAGTVVSVGVPTGHFVAAGDWAASFVADSAVRRALLAPPTRSVASASTVAGRSVEFLVTPIILNGRVIGSFVAASDLAPFQADRSRVLTLSLAEAGVALAAGVLSTFLLLRRLLRTVGGITVTAEEIGAGDVERRLGDQGTDDEVGQLARTFDRMLDRLQAAMEAQRRLLSDVSHQLRTPLTVARGHLEVLQRTGTSDPEAVNETISVVVDELDHMRTLVEQLLLLGRAMEPDFVSPEPIDLRSFLADIDASARVMADRDFRLPEIPDLVIHTDPAKLRGAVLNLVDNAIRATVPGDVIQISAERVGATGAVKIAVDDSGPGIPEDARPLLLGRFERSGSADGGQGLGLAIVKAVAEAHGGAVSIETSSFGGCRVEVILPATLVETPVATEDSSSAAVVDPGPARAPET
jgi:signal transduction histidine kinase